MSVRDEVRQALSELRRSQALLQSPSLTAADLDPSYRIQLQPWATKEAQELHGKFGNRVQLQVGFLPYPLAEEPDPPLRRRDASPMDGTRMEAWISGPDEVRAGENLRTSLSVRNPAVEEIVLLTNGGVTAVIVDPETGDPVGGFSGFQAAPLKIFRIAPGETSEISLLIGTASSVSRLGHCVPPGTWAVTVNLELADPQSMNEQSWRRTLVRTPQLPIIVIS